MTKVQIPLLRQNFEKGRVPLSLTHTRHFGNSMMGNASQMDPNDDDKPSGCSLNREGDNQARHHQALSGRLHPQTGYSNLKDKNYV